MSVFADLKRRTGVGLGGAFLYVVALAAGLGVATTLGTVDYSDGELLLFLAGVVYAFGLLGPVTALSNLPRYLRFVLAGRTTTGDATEGRVALEGEVRERSGTLRTPFQDEPAVCYTTRVLENDRDEADPDEENHWSLAWMDEAATTFAVDDGSGPVRVSPDAETAAFHLGDREEVAVGVGEGPPDPVAAHLTKTDRSLDPSTAYRFQEARLAPGDEAFVYGRAARDPDPVVGTTGAVVIAEAGYPSRVRDRIVLGATMGTVVTGLGLAAMLFVTGGL